MLYSCLKRTFFWLTHRYAFLILIWRIEILSRNFRPETRLRPVVLFSLETQRISIPLQSDPVKCSKEPTFPTAPSAIAAPREGRGRSGHMIDTAPIMGLKRILMAKKVSLKVA